MKNKIRIFRKTQRKRSASHHPLLAFDIENDPITGAFINAGVYGYKKSRGHHNTKDEQIEEFFTNQDEFHEFLLNLRPEGMKEIPCKLITFNLSYDLWFCMKITKDNKTLSNGSNIIVAELDNGLEIMDLTNLTRKGSLEDWIGYLKEDMNKYGIYKKESLDNLEIRVKSDAKATWILGNYLENFFVHEIGIPLKLTIASAARYLFSLCFFTDYWFREEKDLWKSEYERKAYRGGRTEAFKGGVERVFVGYDVNSMYLSIMRDEVFPDPNSAKYVREPKVLPQDVLYIADVTVNIPEQYIGVLPKLNPDDGKLIFPTGTFRGHFVSPELNYSIKECGVKIIKIHSLIKYKSKPYFKKYAEFIWKKRKEYKDKHNKGMDILIKYLGNVLYGGFGQKNKDSFFGKLEDLTLKFVSDNKARPKITIIDGVKYVTVTATEGEDSKHTFPCIPTFITSYSRLFLLKALRANADILIYTDTDSMKVRNTPKDVVIGDGLGEWGYEGVDINVPVYKSKMYGDKCKGVPKRAELVWEDKVRKIYTYEKPNKMKESFRRGLTPALWKKVTKEVSKIDDKRVWIDEKTSMPPVLIII
ncbi:unnamed protein product [marine sediment metagenome]|uniref:DNA-directed DNA polymerase n=1 Tax=marine sediment metagenome TaxID=412755 RepID=X1DXL4_9ZZZZ